MKTLTTLEAVKGEDPDLSDAVAPGGAAGRPPAWITILLLMGLCGFVWLIGWSGLANLD